MTAPAIPFIPPRKTLADLWSALGEVPLDRILFDPPPGTATEWDLLMVTQ